MTTFARVRRLKERGLVDWRRCIGVVKDFKCIFGRVRGRGNVGVGLGVGFWGVWAGDGREGLYNVEYLALRDFFDECVKQIVDYLQAISYISL